MRKAWAPYVGTDRGDHNRAGFLAISADSAGLSGGLRNECAAGQDQYVGLPAPEADYLAGIVLFYGSLAYPLPAYLWGLAAAVGYASYSIVAVIASIEPAVASLLGVLVMKEQMDVFGAAGVGMIFAAIVVLNRKKQDKEGC